MENKLCKKCLIEKNINDFRPLNGVCKMCQAEDKRKKYNEYILISGNKICSKCLMEKDIKDFVKLRNYCKDCDKMNRKEYDTKRYRKKQYEKNKEYYKDKSNKWNKDNEDKYKKYQKEYNLKYVNRRYKEDNLFKISCNIRSLIRQSFKNSGYIKESKTYQILGCTFEEFKIYLENKFETWMNWSNHGLYNGNFEYGWDIDHIVPLFPNDVERTEEDIIRLNHYTNLQPLCSKVNRDIKKNNIT